MKPLSLASFKSRVQFEQHVFLYADKNFQKFAITIRVFLYDFTISIILFFFFRFFGNVFKTCFLFLNLI